MSPLICALALVDHGAAAAAVPSQTEISPVSVTARRLPDLGDPFEIAQRNAKEREQQKRPAQERELAENRALWASRHIDDYQYEISTVGGWGMRSGGVVVKVQGGRIVSMVDATTGAPDTAFAELYGTVPRLFSRIEQLLANSGRQIYVSYDPTNGFPLQIADTDWGCSDCTNIVLFSRFQRHE